VRKLSKREKEVLDILEMGGVKSAKALAEAANIAPLAARSTVRSLRMKFLDGHDDVKSYIVLTKGGYTVEESQANLYYEASFRFRLGFGVLHNGMYVFRRCKQLKSRDFAELKLEYKPKALKFVDIVK